MTDRELIRAIDEHERSCTTWEAGFVENCLRALETGDWLSDKQRAKAQEILARLNGGGGDEDE